MVGNNTVKEAPPGQALPTGTRLEEFVVDRILGSGGFGITYLARDSRLGRQVVIKENLPAQFCWRDTSNLTVQPRHSSGEDADNFQYSLDSFEKEAVTLASLDHPGIVKVLRSFEANGTAYFVMPFVDGTTLDEVMREREAKKKSFSEEELTSLLTKVLDALAYLHDRGIYHRDIKPGNILITHTGAPVLIDFGAARQRLSERSLTVIESPGYTPFEQMQSRGKVGPWSDLYALGGTLYKAITGETPAKAADRIMEDSQVPLAERAELSGWYSQRLLRSIDYAMNPIATDRFESANAWKETIHAFSSDELIRNDWKEDAILKSPSWFYISDESQIGPLTPAEIGRAISSGAITPETLIWEQSMTEWTPAHEVPDLVPLFPKRQTTSVPPSMRANSKIQEASSPALVHANPLSSSESTFPGINRRYYCLILFCLLIGTGIVSSVLGEAAFVGILVLYSGIIWASFQRLANIGRNPWWSLLVIVPILSLWIFVVGTTLPTGYQSHRKFDTGAKVVSGFWIFLLLFIVVSVIGAAG
jgi:serine/threonine protein kinase